MSKMVEKATKVWGGNTGLSKEDAIQFRLAVDFDGCTEKQILDFAFGERAIAARSSLKKISIETLRKMIADGNGTVYIHALECGAKPEDPAEVRAKLIAQAKTMTPEEKAAFIEMLMDDGEEE